MGIDEVLARWLVVQRGIHHVDGFYVAKRFLYEYYSLSRLREDRVWGLKISLEKYFPHIQSWDVYGTNDFHSMVCSSKPLPDDYYRYCNHLEDAKFAPTIARLVLPSPRTINIHEAFEHDLLMFATGKAGSAPIKIAPIKMKPCQPLDNVEVEDVDALSVQSLFWSGTFGGTKFEEKSFPPALKEFCKTYNVRTVGDLRKFDLSFLKKKLQWTIDAGNMDPFWGYNNLVKRLELFKIGLERGGVDVLHEITLTAEEAAAGCSKPIAVREGKVKIPAETPDGKIIRYEGKGEDGGDLVLKVHVMKPEPKPEPVVAVEPEAVAAQQQEVPASAT